MRDKSVTLDKLLGVVVVEAASQVSYVFSLDFFGELEKYTFLKTG